MDIVEAFAYLWVFVCMYGSFLAVSYVVDKLLRRFFKKGIFPEGYFKL